MAHQYKITVSHTVTYVSYVSAENKEAAEEKALNSFDKAPLNPHDESVWIRISGEREVLDVERSDHGK